MSTLENVTPKGVRLCDEGPNGLEGEFRAHPRMGKPKEERNHRSPTNLREEGVG